MSLGCSAEAQSYFQSDEEMKEPGLNSFFSLRGRFACLAQLFEKLFLFPVALVLKAYKTGFRCLGAILSALLLLATLGLFRGIRELFYRRVSSLAKDLADWMLMPFAALTCFARAFLGFAIHPALYFGS